MDPDDEPKQAAATHAATWSERTGVKRLLISDPRGMGVFELAALAARRARQLQRGCLPKIDRPHTLAVTALLEVITGKVARVKERAPQESAGNELNRASTAASGAMAVGEEK